MIALWMGPAFAYAGMLLIVFAFGEFLQMTQSVTGSIILATAQHRFLALVSVLETAVTVALIVYASKTVGLLGVAAAIAVPQVLFTGVSMLVYGCRITGVNASQYAKEALLPPALAGLLPVFLLVSLSAWNRPHSWALLIGYTGVYILAYSGMCVLVMKPFRLSSA